MLRSYVSAKIHGIHVTAKSVRYHGSVTIGADLLAAVGIEHYERVYIVNLSTGGRWDTYVIPGELGQFVLNGGGARLGEVGDECVVMTYAMSETFETAPVIVLDVNNAITTHLTYE
jgi:aspartate 1-decarboxylase